VRSTGRHGAWRRGRGGGRRWALLRTRRQVPGGRSRPRCWPRRRGRLYVERRNRSGVENQSACGHQRWCSREVGVMPTRPPPLWPGTKASN